MCDLNLREPIDAPKCGRLIEEALKEELESMGIDAAKVAADMSRMKQVKKEMQ